MVAQILLTLKLLEEKVKVMVVVMMKKVVSVETGPRLLKKQIWSLTQHLSVL